MYSVLSESPFNVRRITKICWARFASSMKVSGHSVLSSSSFDKTRARCRTSSANRSNALGVSD